MVKCSHCEDDRLSRCSYADCPFEVEEAQRTNNALHARITELAAENERLKEDATRWSMEASRYAKALDKAREREVEALSRTGTVKVKALEWSQRGADWYAETEVGQYAVGVIRMRYVTMLCGITSGNLNDLRLEAQPFDTPEAAKAAAQADYERRILSALEPSAPEAGALKNEQSAPEVRQEAVSIDLMQRVWANLFFNEEDAGFTFQTTLNDVVDWLSLYGALPEPTPTVTSNSPVGYFIRNRSTGRLLTGHPSYFGRPHAPEGYDAVAVYTRPSEQAVTEAMVEAVARIITKWLGFAWDGLHDGRVTDKGFPVFLHHSQTGWKFQGHKGDMIDLARAALKAAMEAGHG